MAYRIDKETGDLVINGFEQGIFPSPHKGIANIQNGNIATESGEVMASFARAQQTMTDTSATGTLAFVDTSHVSLSIASTNNLFKGNWIAVTGSSNTSQLPNGTYYVPPSTGANFQLANYYNAMNFVPATATINTLVVGGGGGAGGTGNTGAGTRGAGGGGGAGAVTALSGVSVAIAAFPVVVGTGGAGGTTTGNQGTNGVSTIFNGTTAAGGGGGGGATTEVGLSGASGGGSGTSVSRNGNGLAGGAATAGFAGGSSTGNASPAGQAQAGGGGGGAGAIGGTGTSPFASTGGSGGVGVSSSISGSAVFYGGGGGASATNNNGNTDGTAGSGAIGGGGSATKTGGGVAGADGTVIISYPTGSLTATGGTITTSGGNTIHTFTTSGTWTVTAIATVTVPAFLTGFTAGLTASFTMIATIGRPIAQATETYFASGTVYHRYYVLDANNLVWVYDDQNEVLYSASDNVSWFLPDYVTNYATKASGIAVISGFLVSATEHGMFGKPVVALGNTNTQTTTWVQFPEFTGWQGSSRSVNTPHFCFVGHQGILYITDASYIVSIFPDTTIADTVNNASTGDNVQTLCSWTNNLADPTHTGDFSIISGTTPVTSDGKRLPVVFFTVNNGVLPNAITAGTVYYIQSTIVSFNVYAASTGGSQLDIQTGASGSQYFNSFYPIATASASTGASPTEVLSGQRLTLPDFEVAQCIAEIGNNALIGCASSVVYPWDQVSNLPSGIINLPESNTVNIITVNQMGYIFAGNKANIYLTDGNQASQVLSVPDYAAGVPGSPATYVEPSFSWGGASYIRGRVYFSIQDQTSTKAGNCGGIWSFIPTQNLYIGQDTGIALRLENQNSYASYNGMASLIIVRQNQNTSAPLFWSPWVSSISSPIYGIDYSTQGTNATFSTIIETDAIPTGTMLKKETFKQIEFKLASPLDVGATVVIKYRNNLTGVWTGCGTAHMEGNRLSGYFSAVFEKTQWLQLQSINTPITSTATTNSFVRMAEVRVR